MADKPYDEILGDPKFLESIKNNFGAEWFWDYPQKSKRRRPLFDKTKISRIIKA